jgi:hypothetical protein
MIKLTIDVWPPMPDAAHGGYSIDCKDVTETELSYFKTMLTPQAVEAYLAEIRKRADPNLQH